MSNKENQIATPEMGYFCFESVYNKLTRQTQMKNILKNPTFTNDSYPLFVTWKKIEGKKEILRGCIGTFVPLPLHEGLKKYSLESAFKDNRFIPVMFGELKTLSVSVSILKNFESCQNIDDWDIGRHGIQIKLDLDQVDPGTAADNDKAAVGSPICFTATFLPEVATENGWTKLQTIDALLRKSGYKETITDEIRNKIKVTRYQSDKITVSYQDYANHCNK